MSADASSAMTAAAIAGTEAAAAAAKATYLAGTANAAAIPAGAKPVFPMFAASCFARPRVGSLCIMRAKTPAPFTKTGKAFAVSHASGDSRREFPSGRKTVDCAIVATERLIRSLRKHWIFQSCTRAIALHRQAQLEFPDFIRQHGRAR